MAVITVSREYGSRGEEITQEVAKELGYSYFDKDILADVARIANTTEDEIRQYDEKDEHGLYTFLKKLFIAQLSPNFRTIIHRLCLSIGQSDLLKTNKD